MKWRSADGRTAKIKDLSDGHFTNILNWVADHPGSYSLDICLALVKEAEYRKVILFAQGLPYPEYSGSRWELIDPETGQGCVEPPPQEYLDAVQERKKQTTDDI